MKKVVITSSIASIMGGGNNHNNKERYTEDDWTKLDSPGLTTYFKAKTLGEKM